MPHGEIRDPMADGLGHNYRQHDVFLRPDSTALCNRCAAYLLRHRVAAAMTTPDRHHLLPCATGRNAAPSLIEAETKLGLVCLAVKTPPTAITLLLIANRGQQAKRHQ